MKSIYELGYIISTSQEKWFLKFEIAVSFILLPICCNVTCIVVLKIGLSQGKLYMIDGNMYSMVLFFVRSFSIRIILFGFNKHNVLGFVKNLKNW
jgi:hypothetical protein